MSAVPWQVLPIMSTVSGADAADTFGENSERRVRHGPVQPETQQPELAGRTCCEKHHTASQYHGIGSAFRRRLLTS